MRNLTTYAPATLLAATLVAVTLLANPVFAAERGNHVKQADPAYFGEQTMVTAQPARSVVPALPVAQPKQIAQQKKAQKQLKPSAHRRDLGRAE